MLAFEIDRLRLIVHKSNLAWETLLSEDKHKAEVEIDALMVRIVAGIWVQSCAWPQLFYSQSICPLVHDP